MLWRMLIIYQHHKQVFFSSDILMARSPQAPLYLEYKVKSQTGSLHIAGAFLPCNCFDIIIVFNSFLALLEADFLCRKVTKLELTVSCI